MCDSERGDLFFHEAGAVVGHLTERRYVSSVERLTRAELLFRSPVRRLSLEPQIFCPAPLNFIYASLFVVFAEHLLLPKVEMVEMARPNLRPGSSHSQISFLTLNPSCVIDLLIQFVNCLLTEIKLWLKTFFLLSNRHYDSTKVR